jgi:hypothetical protein
MSKGMWHHSKQGEFMRRTSPRPLALQIALGLKSETPAWRERVQLWGVEACLCITKTSLSGAAGSTTSRRVFFSLGKSQACECKADSCVKPEL